MVNNYEKIKSLMHFEIEGQPKNRGLSDGVAGV